MVLSSALLIMMLVLIPLLFAGINRSRKVSKKSGKDLGVNYGQSLLGFKPNYHKRENTNLIFVYGFLFVRIAYLMIVFFIPSGWV